MPDKKTDADGNVAQFCAVTGATTREAKDFLDKYKRPDVAIDAYYNNPNEFGNRRKAEPPSVPSTSKLGQLFDVYKDEDGDINVDGTISFCGDLEVDPEDVVLLAIAFELKSPRMGLWKRDGWVNGWKSIGADTIPAMKAALPKLRDQLGSDPVYFKKVYNYTFDFARSEGQRSLSLETAQAFWSLLLPHGFKGGALVRNSDEQDVNMDGDGWKEEYIQWWFDFLHERGGKGVSKDTWIMFLDFVRSIDSEFKTYDIDAAWPSTIDDFVDFAKEHLAKRP